MIIPSNLHTHTTYCDGKSTARQMVDAALERGFVSLGFSGHSPLDYATDWTMTDEAAYQSEIRALAAEYRDRIEILCGIEWDSESPVCNEGYDYTIGSVHTVRNAKGYWAVDESPERLAACAQDGFGGDFYAMCGAYYDAVLQSALRPGVDVAGHFDVVAKYNADGRFFDESDPRYRTAALEALSAICDARPELIFECNVGGMVRAGRSEPYPPLWALRYLRRRGMRVTLTSDAHCARFLDTGFDLGVQLLRTAGYRELVILKDGKFTEYPI